MKSVFFKELQDLTQRLSITVKEDGQDVSNDFILEFTNSFDQLFWKGEIFSLQAMDFLWKESPHFRCQGNTLKISSRQNWAEFQKTREILTRFKDLVYRENLQSLHLWPDASKVLPSGFSESKLEDSAKLLKEIYRDGLMVQEKKGLVLDLDLCQGPNLVGIDRGHPGIIDAASQIASLAVGNNHPLRRSMFLRPELRTPTWGGENWDVREGFSRLISEQSGLPHVRFVNSGAEAMETAVLSLLKAYPRRRKVLAFNGSFHGRCLLALHATHSPPKRTPFEFFPERVEFLDFPENKEPLVDPEDPSLWTELWSQAQSPRFSEMAAKFSATSDSQSKEDLRCLLAVRESIVKDLPLCVVIEPIQCEGGDRYGTSRFFRGLRLLTRAFDVALVFDEVQSGMGLGGSFFWFHQFGLKKADGSPDFPDALYMAKKAQVGFAASRFELPGCDEFSPASLYRGYIQANDLYDWDPSVLEAKVRSLLKIFQAGLGDDIIRFPRSKGLSFAFDLPTAEFLNDMIKIRFEHGLLFYPAGTLTARFRVTKDIRDEQLLQIFINLYSCASAVALQKGLKPKRSIADWNEDLPYEWLEEMPEVPFETHSKFHRVPIGNLPALSVLREEDWDKVFREFFHEAPQLLHSAWNERFTLDHPPASIEELIKVYRTEPEFTQMDLFWIASRFFGTPVRRMKSAEADSRIEEVRRLEELVYEPERVSPADFICEQAKSSESIVLISEGGFGELRGLCVSVPLHLCTDVPLVATDPEAVEGSKVLYSYDLTIHPGHQGLGLGLRLKSEQYIEARRRGVLKIKSRNRYPEASAMDALNHKFGAVTLQKNPLDYGGKATALYQGLNLPTQKSKPYLIKETSHGSLLNKMTLSNFVTPSFIYNTQILSDFLPPELRHVYYSSGRSESIEKSMRLLRHFRPTGKLFLSVEGDTFSFTTACGASLGGDPARLRYFDWPLVKSPENLDQTLKALDSKTVFGFYVEPIRIDGSRKSPDLLKNYISVARKHGIPIVFNESNSWGWRYETKSFLAGEGDLMPDISVFFAGGQLGVVAARKEFFLDKALMMISTWDGDDYSLSLLKERIFELKAAYART
jgi:4-aminobutyrate aminotransferase-like enzyme